jgi:2-isopropylmalate synthase
VIILSGRKKVEDIAAIEATVMVRVGKEIEHTASVGNGPVNALDYALRKALLRFYPSLETLKLLDYKVRILLGEKGTAATVRVLITSGDEENRWETVGVATDVIDASRQALIDAVVYKLMKDDGLASLSSKK